MTFICPHTKKCHANLCPHKEPHYLRDVCKGTSCSVADSKNWSTEFFSCVKCESEILPEELFEI